ncbi:MAG: hypothetical protein PHR46_01500 [Candidatus Absconditabacteria bacterium]|nr:hypothetical protein [Candidatus Absconditabacteria bacterium]
MSQKETVLLILHQLKDHRDLSEGMIALIEAGFMDKDTYTNLLFMISGAVKSLPAGTLKDSLQEQVEQLKQESKKSENLA